MNDPIIYNLFRHHCLFFIINYIIQKEKKRKKRVKKEEKKKGRRGGAVGEKCNKGRKGRKGREQPKTKLNVKIIAINGFPNFT